MPPSANGPKNPSNARADAGIRAPITPLSQLPLTNDPRIPQSASNANQAVSTLWKNHLTLNLI